jgi:hypothetical protein
MTLPFTRRKPARPVFVVEDLGTRWQVRGSELWREAVVRYPDGRRVRRYLYDGQLAA